VVVKAGRHITGTFIMTDISPAVSRTDDGAVLTIEVSAGAKRAVFPSGYNEWRKAVGCSVRAPAQEGKANREVIAIIAETLGIPRKNVRILSGETSSLKRVQVEGEDPGELVRQLTRALDRS
jgi:uncharacterized protein (TIGR00251 family)